MKNTAAKTNRSGNELDMKVKRGHTLFPVENCMEIALVYTRYLTLLGNVY